MFKERYREENERIKSTPEARRRALKRCGRRHNSPYWENIAIPAVGNPPRLPPSARCSSLPEYLRRQALCLLHKTPELLPVNTEPLSGLDGYETLYTLVTNISH